mmetsp:Transcript_38234/g.86950  ORF Transcript_38234/g.86950 Transcript_38234/m.86950 type:complete len:239 (-) Transcript_38234:210-926(-)
MLSLRVPRSCRRGWMLCARRRGRSTSGRGARLPSRKPAPSSSALTCASSRCLRPRHRTSRAWRSCPRKRQRGHWLIVRLLLQPRSRPLARRAVSWPRRPQSSRHCRRVWLRQDWRSLRASPSGTTRQRRSWRSFAKRRTAGAPWLTSRWPPPKWQLPRRLCRKPRTLSRRWPQRRPMRSPRAHSGRSRTAWRLPQRRHPASSMRHTSSSWRGRGTRRHRWMRRSSPSCSAASRVQRAT